MCKKTADGQSAVFLIHINLSRKLGLSGEEYDNY